MGSTHDTTATARRRRVATTGMALAALAALGLAACTGGDDDDGAASITQAGAAAMPDMAPTTTVPTGALADSASRDEGGAAVPAAGGSIGTLPMQVIGQDIAIMARATVQAADVRSAVDRVTTTVTTHGGHVASANIDYGEAPGETTTTAPGGDPGRGARATLVIAIPPSELGAVQATLDDVGDVQSFEQQGEDVTDQLTDLDTRIANQRASVARIRELYATATDVEAIVRIEGELTNRETALEQLLALQANLQGRVAMSTLTIDITATPVAATTDDGDGTTIGDALGAGWSAFAGALFAIALVLTAAMPFLLLAAGVGMIVWLVLRRVHREPAPLPISGATPEAAEREEAVANRPG
jgi:hypothetical protein